RRVKINHVRNAFNIETPGHNIGSHKDPAKTVAKLANAPQPVILTLIGVNDGTLIGKFFSKQFKKPVGQPFVCNEDQDTIISFFILKQFPQEIYFGMKIRNLICSLFYIFKRLSTYCY